MNKKLIVDGNLLGRKSFYKFKDFSTNLSLKETKRLSPSVFRAISSTLNKTIRAKYEEKISESTGNKLTISTKGEIDNRLEKVIKSLEKYTLHTGVLYGMLRSLLATYKNYNIGEIIICYDPPPIYKIQKASPIPKRKIIDIDYKVRKKEMSTELLFAISLQLAQSFFYRIGIEQVTTKTFEADDLLQRYSQHIFKGNPCLILTNDHDLFQLLEKDRVSLLRIGEKNPIYSHEDFVEEFGIKPSQWRDVQMIGGCSTDSVKGIPGISSATAVELVKKYRNTKNMFKQYKTDPFSTRTTNILTKEIKAEYKNLKKSYSLVRLYGLHPKLEREIISSKSGKSADIKLKSSLEFLRILEFKSFLTKNSIKLLKSLIN